MRYVVYVLLVIVVLVALYSAFSEIRSRFSTSFDISQISKEFKKYFGWNLNYNNDLPRGEIEIKIPNVIPETQNINIIPQTYIENLGPNLVLPKGFLKEDLSKYFGLVEIVNVVPPQKYSYYSYGTPLSYFNLQTRNFNENEKKSIDVTGWKVKTNKNRTVFIPQAIEDFNPYGPQNQTNVFLNQNDFVIIYSSKSPIGKNLRLNKCTGYLNNSYKFEPQLPNSCPSLDRGEFISFSGKCQSYLFSVYSCKEPTSNEKNMLSGPDDYNCRVYLDTLNYGGCYKKYRSTTDFFSREWRIWLNEEMPFDSEHDRLLLFDKEGLLVDEYIY